MRIEATKFFTAKFCLAILIFLVSGCSSALYYPSQQLYDDPAKVGAESGESNPKIANIVPEDIWFKSEDGTKLNGWYFKAPGKKKPKALIVFFHGNGENISSHFLTLRWILGYGFDYFIFDYRGYGRSEGDPSPRGTMEDGKAAIRWAAIRAREKKAPLVIFGQSLGGAVALRSVIELGREVPLKLMAVDSTFASYRSEGASVLSSSWLTWIFQPLAYLLLSDRYAPSDRIREIAPTPLLVMHGDADKTVPIKHGEKLFKLAQQPKEFWRIPGGEHIDVFWVHNGEYRRRFIEKLRQVLTDGGGQF